MTDPAAKGGAAIGPLSYVVLGVILGGLGWLLVSGDNVPLGVVAMVAGIALVVFGGVAQAVKLGVITAGRRGDDPPGPGS